MDIVVTVTRDELARLLEQFAPIRIHFTPKDEDRRWLELERPTSVAFVAGVGVRIVTSGRIRYEVLGIKVPARIRELSVMLVPTVVDAERGRQSLAFRLELEKADLVRVPGLIDDALAARVNAALTPESTHMIWHFSETLALSVPLPDRLEPLDGLQTSASSGAVGVDDKQVSFALRLDLGIGRRSERPKDD